LHIFVKLNIFEVIMNIWAWPPLVSAIVCFFLGSFVFFSNSRPLINKLFLSFCLLAAFIAFAQFMARQSESAAGAFYWIKAYATWPILLALQFHFIFLYINTDKVLKRANLLVHPLVYLPALFFVYILLFTDSIISGPIKMYWGYTGRISTHSLTALALGFWSIFISFSTLFLSFQHYKNANTLKMKKQAKLITIGLSFNVFTSIFTEALPLMLQMQKPEMTAMFGLAVPIFFGYAIKKYDWLALSLNSLGEQIVSSISDCLFVIDMNGNIHTVNQTAVNILGFSRQELHGRPIDMVITYTDIERPFMPNATANLHASGVSDINAFLIKKDGKKTPISLSTSLMDDEDGRFQGIVYIAKDITRRIQLEQDIKEMEQRFRMLFDSAPDAYYLNDLTGTFIDGNKAAESLLGYPKEELIGKSFLKLKILTPVQLLKASSLLARNALGKATGPDEFILTRKDGSKITADIRTCVIKIKGKPVVLGSARDIGERKKTEEALQQSLNELELFSHRTIGREIRVIELKKEINVLLRSQGRPEKYTTSDEG